MEIDSISESVSANQIPKGFQLNWLIDGYSYVGEAHSAGSGAIIAIHFISCFWHYLQPHPEAKTLLDSYIYANYWAITTLTTVGYGDITPASNLARVFTMGTMVLGVGVYGIVIGNVAQMLMKEIVTGRKHGKN